MADTTLLHCSGCRRNRDRKHFWPSQLFRIRKSGICKDCNRKRNTEYQKRVRANPCSVSGCHRVQQARGLCAVHYQDSDKKKIRKENSITGPRTKCSVSGCDKHVVARGLCAAHYERWKKYGFPDGLSENTKTFLARRASGKMDRGGYRMIYCPGHSEARRISGWGAEHRVVMSNHLGRPLLENEIIIRAAKAKKTTCAIEAYV